MRADDYKSLLHSQITKDYKTAHHATVAAVKRKEKSIACDLNLQDKMETIAEKNAFVTLKDHKPNFNNRPTCRLISPSKSEVGIVSKNILDRINNQVRRATAVNQWKNR